MRALGPGSVSSFLKIALDVVHVLLWILLIILVMTVLGVLIAQPFIASNITLDNVDVNGETDPERVRELIRTPIIPGVIGAAACYIGGLVFIVGRLRRIFVTLAKGDPFQPDNVKRLRLIGFTLAGIELLSYLLRAIVAWWERVGPIDVDDVDVRVGQGFNLTIWFAVLVVFVLAEVFREGARLRREAELTI